MFTVVFGELTAGPSRAVGHDNLATIYITLGLNIRRFIFNKHSFMKYGLVVKCKNDLPRQNGCINDSYYDVHCLETIQGYNKDVKI